MGGGPVRLAAAHDGADGDRADGNSISVQRLWLAAAVSAVESAGQSAKERGIY